MMKNIMVKVVNNEDQKEMDGIYRLRYQVYVNEKHWVPQMWTTSGMAMMMNTPGISGFLNRMRVQLKFAGNPTSEGDW